MGSAEDGAGDIMQGACRTPQGTGNRPFTVRHTVTCSCGPRLPLAGRRRGSADEQARYSLFLSRWPSPPASGALGSLAVAQTDVWLADVARCVASGGHIACPIKGNISINTGERIYHVPGQMYYDATIISPQFGERWFCTEAEARAAGWRKARR